MAATLLRRGSSGREVSELQSKLNANGPTFLPRLAVDSIFGPRTDARVREFQRLSGLQVDGIVGPNTRAALDRRSPTPNPADAADLIHCTNFPRPAPRTSLLSSPGLLASLAPVAPPPPPSPLAEALVRKSEAQKWVGKSVNALNIVLTLMRTGLKADFLKLATMEETTALNTHFKLDRSPNPLQFVSSLLQIYNLISICINNSNKLWVEDLSNLNDFANAVLGGFFEQQDAFRGRIRFCPNFTGKGIRFQTMVIIHEASHFVGRQPKIVHFASELPGPNGTPVDSSKNYVQLSPDEAARNAYSYAQFSLHMEMRTDHRITPFSE
jgi:hypothetical protein